MPRLLSKSGWTFQLIESADLLFGDVLFLKRKAEIKLVAHAALVIGPDRIFHCKKDAGPVVETIEKVYEVFEQTLKEELLRYIDPRNIPLREKYGIYLPNTC